MRRREFIAAIDGAAAWPLTARAQNAGRARRVGVLAGISGDDPEAQLRCAAFLEVLRKLGWTNGQNVQVEVRWAAGDCAYCRAPSAGRAAAKLERARLTCSYLAKLRKPMVLPRAFL
jgi:hypothetical protein